MIIVKLMGGLGNQMFQYAIGRALAMKHEVPLKFDASLLNQNISLDHTKRALELNVFNLEIQLASIEEIEEFNHLKHNRLLRHLQRKVPFLFSKLYYAESGMGFQSTINFVPKNVYLEGYWQCEKYFKHIQEILLKEFELKEQMSESVQVILNKIKSTNSISVHVRRGDYANSKVSNTYHGLCSKEYYQNAISKILVKNKEAEIFVFSDDMEWCKSNLSFNMPTNYVQHSKSACWDLYLMSQCNHNVLANSSFSWWGAWLNQHTNKQVLAPEYWYTNIKSNSINILAENWEVIS